MANPSIQALWSAVEAGDIEAVDQLTKPSMLDRLLLRKNSLVDAPPEKGIENGAGRYLNETPLFSAASAGNTEMCEVLIRNGAEVNSTSSSDDMMELTPLHQAAINGRSDTCRVLIDAGADVNESGLHWSHYTNKQSILHSAAERSYAGVCQELLSAGASVDALADGISPLHMAAKAGSAQTCSALIAAGAEVNLATLSIDNGYLGAAGQTPLHMATTSDVARVLLAAGADAYAMDHDSELPGTNADYPDVVSEISAWRAQHEADRASEVSYVQEEELFQSASAVQDHNFPYRAKDGQPAWLRKELDKGIDVNSKTESDGRTALMIAADRGSMDLCEALVSWGADVHVQDNCGKTALHWAADSWKADETRGQICQFLIEAGADVNAQNHDLETPLHLSLSNEGVEVASFLLEAGADVNARTALGDTPMMRAAQQGLEISTLLEYGADVNDSNNQSKTALHFAAASRSVGAVDDLIAAGADTNAADQAGNTPLHEAGNNSYITKSPQQCQSLIAAGANLDAQNAEGLTPLHVAMKNNRAQVCDVLLGAGASLFVIDGHGRVPLEYAEPEYRAQVEQRQLEANTAPAPARYATDDEPWKPSAADSDSFERQLAGVREGEPIVRNQAPVRARNVRL